MGFYKIVSFFSIQKFCSLLAFSWHNNNVDVCLKLNVYVKWKLVILKIVDDTFRFVADIYNILSYRPISNIIKVSVDENSWLYCDKKNICRIHWHPYQYSLGAIIIEYAV